MALQRQGCSLVGSMKATSRRAFVLKLNLAFLSFFLVTFVVLLLLPFSLFDDDGTSLVRCLFLNCQQGKVIENVAADVGGMRRASYGIPSFVHGFRSDMRIGVVNVDGEQAEMWREVGRVVEVGFEKVSDSIQWKELFPEWIDEEEENEVPKCPNIPMPNVEWYDVLDVVVVDLPCRFPTEGWSRDVWRLQVHLAAAKVAVEKGRRDGNGKVKVAAKSGCRPMFDVFRCDDVVRREKEWWLFEVDVERLEQKLALPVGSCRLGMPLEVPANNNHSHQKSLLASPTKREAYVTVIHSSDRYVCGAITLAQSLLLSGTDRDLVLLHDASIPAPTLAALAAAGWTLHLIKRIRNPRAEKLAYNEYNYSKFRLWQLTKYSKLVFIDADIIVLRNLDRLFDMPQLSAIGNDNVIFNSGVMVIEPSNCTFNLLMESRDEIVSSNGGDQGFLNEVFVWWHRLPKQVNFLKINFFGNNTDKLTKIRLTNKKERNFASEPPVIYTIHFLGLKPWLCYRDYDCNWNVWDSRIFASDAAHRQWWKVYDQMDEKIKPFCELSKGRKQSLERDLNYAKKAKFPGGHWKINITDPRRFH